MRAQTGHVKRKTTHQQKQCVTKNAAVMGKPIREKPKEKNDHFLEN
jgi:hypothetical protein